MEIAELLSRAESLASIENPTAEQTAEIESLTAQLETANADFVEKEEKAAKVAKLRSAAQLVQKEMDRVPSRNRPDSAFVISDRRTNAEQDRIQVPAIKRHSYAVPEIKEETYEGLKQLGYSDDVIGIAATDQYARNMLRFLKSSGKTYSEDITKAMTSAGEGEPLLPIQWQELILQPQAVNMLRGQVRTLPTNSLVNRFPRILSDSDRYTSHVRVSWGGETPSSYSDQGTAIQTDYIDIQPHEVYCTGDFSISMFEDNAYGMQSVAIDLFSEALDVNVEEMIIAGGGITVTQPYGMTEKVAGNRVVPEVETGTRGALAYADLVRLKKKVHQRFRANGVFVFNSNTWELLATMVDDNGRPLFQEQQTAGIPGTPGGGATWWDGKMLGRPYIIAESMPDIGDLDDDSDELPFIYYADFGKLYYMLNRVGMTIKILDQIKYTQGLTVYSLRARMGGRVVQPKAGAALINKPAVGP